MPDFHEKRLTEVFITGYRNLIDCRLSLDQISILVGPNNSGKSNFLDLFSLVSQLHFGGQPGKDYVKNKIWNSKGPIEIRLAGTVSRDEEINELEYQIKFRLKEENQTYSLIIDWESFTYKSKSAPGKPKHFFYREATSLSLHAETTKFKKQDISIDEPAFSIIKTYLSKEERLASNFWLYFEFLDYFAPSLFSVHSIRSSYDKSLKNTLEEIYPLQEKKDEAFLNFKNSLKDILDLSDFQIRDITPQVENLTEKIYLCLIFENGREKITVLDNMSDGSKILFLMLYHIFIDKRSLVCIEEPEIGLHPRALNKVLRIFVEKRTHSQAIITTHSAYLLNLVNPKNVYLLEGNENKMSTIVTISSIPELQKRLSGKYVNFGDLFADNFKPRLKPEIVD